MSLITNEYKELQQRLHAERPDYGTSDGRFAEFIQGIAQKLHTRDILSYGAGKGALQKRLPFPIQNYDPCVVEFNKRPRPADIVCCCDVLEHIEMDCLPEVLGDLAKLTKQVLFLNVACRPAVKVLADGRNAHLIQEHPSWWIQQLIHSGYGLDLVSFQAGKGEFTAVLTPHMPIEADA